MRRPTTTISASTTPPRSTPPPLTNTANSAISIASLRTVCLRRHDRRDGKTDEDVEIIAGQRDQLAGKLRERYGHAAGESERLVKEFENSSK
jgi:hypothetical protein